MWRLQSMEEVSTSITCAADIRFAGSYTRSLERSEMASVDALGSTELKLRGVQAGNWILS